MNKCHLTSPLSLLAWGSPTLCAWWWGSRQLPRSHLPPGRWEGRTGGKKTIGVVRTCPKQWSQDQGHCWKVQRALRPHKLSPKSYSPSLQITSLARHSNTTLKFFALEKQSFPSRPHTLWREMFLEMNFLLGNKKPGFSFLWLCPPYELDPRIQPRSELVPSYSLSFKKVCCLPSPQELLSALHCRRPRKVLLAPQRSHWWTSQKDIYWQAG